MSRTAIAAALAREDLVFGERLVAFSLASFADRDGRARPGTPAAATRAGLRRSWYLEARDRLVRRGLVAVELQASGRGRASVLALPFTAEGPWWEGEINAELFETVLAYSRSQGASRLLLAAMAALADEHRVVQGLATGRLCAAAGVTDRTYRRARASLLASGQVILRAGAGGRGNTNVWEIVDLQSHGAAGEPVARRRAVPPSGARPLVTVVASPPGARDDEAETAASDVAQDLVTAPKQGQDRTIVEQNRPLTAGVSSAKRGPERTLSRRNGPASAGVSGETPAQTPAETRARIARAGREPQNPRILDPPSPPAGGSAAGQVVVEETYVTERGRRRKRLVTVDLEAVRARLAAVEAADRAAWDQVRMLLLEAVGKGTFEIWLARLELIAVDYDRRLVIAAPEVTSAWVRERFGPLLERCAARAGRAVRFAEQYECAAVNRRPAGPAAPGEEGHRELAVAATALGTQSAASMSQGRLGRASTDAPPSAPSCSAPDRSPIRASALAPCGSAYTHVYDQRREASL